MCVLVAQSCPTLCDPVDCSPPGSSVHGILQARILEWVAILFSRGSSQPGIKLRSPTLWADSLLSEPPGKPILHIVGAKKKLTDDGIIHWNYISNDSYPCLIGRSYLLLLAKLQYHRFFFQSSKKKHSLFQRNSN